MRPAAGPRVDKTENAAELLTVDAIRRGSLITPGSAAIMKVGEPQIRLYAADPSLKRAR